MGGHPSRPAVAGRLQRSTRRLGRAALERLRSTTADRRAFLTLLRVGFTDPHRSPVVRWSLTPPFHPYQQQAAGGLFSVALSRGSPRVAVNDHPALWSPDVPRRRVSPPTRPPSRLVRRARESTDKPTSCCSTDELNDVRQS